MTLYLVERRAELVVGDEPPPPSIEQLVLCEYEQAFPRERVASVEVLEHFAAELYEFALAHVLSRCPPRGEKSTEDSARRPYVLESLVALQRHGSCHRLTRFAHRDLERLARAAKLVVNRRKHRREFLQGKRGRRPEEHDER